MINRKYSIKAYLTAMTIALMVVIIFSLTLFAAWSSARIQSESSHRELSLMVKQGSVVLQNYVERKQANLELWLSQPIVGVFFRAPELAAMSVPGLRGFFSRISTRDADIATVLFVHDGKVVFDSSGMMNQLMGPKAQSRVQGFIQDSNLSNIVVASNEQKDGQAATLFIKSPFKKQDGRQTGDYGIVGINLDKVQKDLFANTTIGKSGFTCLLTDTGSGLRASGVTGPDKEKQDFVEGCQTWRKWSDVPSSYEMLNIKVSPLDGFPLAMVGVSSEKETHREIGFAILICLVAGSVAVIIGATGAMLISKHLSRSLMDFVAGIQRLELDHLDNFRIDQVDTRIAEVSILHGAFEMMVKRIIASRDEIQTKNRNLEEMAGSLRHQRNLLQATLSSIGDGVITTDMDRRITFMNRVAEMLSEHDLASVVNCRLEEVFTIVNEFTRQPLDDPINKVLRHGATHGLADHALLITGKGREIPISNSGAPILDHEGNVSGAVFIFRDVTEQKEQEKELKESEERFRILFESNPAALWLIDFSGVRGEFDAIQEQAAYLASYLEQHPDILERCTKTIRILSVNSAAFSLFKADTFEHLIEKINASISTEASDAFRALLVGLWKGDTRIMLDSVVKSADGELCSVTVTCAFVPGYEDPLSRVLIVVNDITERVELEEQLHQAQKLESVGRLAGGVAHDYNNMLSVILGYAELAEEKAVQHESIRKDLKEIRTAAQRSADITRQLLAFARKQTIAPRVIDLNQTVECMLSMLRRLIGEDLDLTWHPKNMLWPIEIDPTQVDQILANLCVNARDAISGTGKITIETDFRTFDEKYCRFHKGFIPGDFAMLAISDDGFGMDKETQKLIFDPFFTTKEIGQGTGLGLATVFGIVKQNGGFINVYSELGKGTTFKIYFPRYTGEEVGHRYQRPDRIPFGQGEKLLVVEDEASTLQLLRMMLTGLGYSVLAANTPREAIELIKENNSDCALMVTDVIMPEMNGRDLEKHIRSLCPGIKTLFMSGYTANVIAHHGILDEGVKFIQKPFSKVELAIQVRSVLDEPDMSDDNPWTTA
ncbi:PAS domain-containing sensor histidine kinase [Desulfosarcina ovata]|uniref:histidine kinase n=1 Tax=Desulfosarcina ovata subsp. ovata TaxID=2752305 RepID=A0A5K8A3Z2_9BACT|nr:PAS domain-containing sensor histidine kinase [Desulfosarcina ovata]BBO87128.1 hypothetical protein DSCOOX_03080 [Desulfosarcina ovata subsp. ovata]